MTSKWNYRVFLEADGDYIIREVFYEEDGLMQGCTENAVWQYFSRSTDDRMRFY